MLTKSEPSWRSPMPTRGAVMSSLELRLRKLEASAYAANVAKFSDAELGDYIRTLELRSPPWWDAVLARVLRHPSTFPIVRDAPFDAEIDHYFAGRHFPKL